MFCVMHLLPKQDGTTTGADYYSLLIMVYMFKSMHRCPYKSIRWSYHNVVNKAIGTYNDNAAIASTEMHKAAETDLARRILHHQHQIEPKRCIATSTHKK